jgi:hypothetical protein
MISAKDEVSADVNSVRRESPGRCATRSVSKGQTAQNETQQTVYRLKHALLSDYLRQQLKSPAIQMTFA